MHAIMLSPLLVLPLVTLLDAAPKPAASHTPRCRPADTIRTAAGSLFSVSRERADDVRLSHTSALPCSTTAAMGSGDGDEYMATFHQQTCVKYTVTAPKGRAVTVCFLPDVVWLSLGRARALQDNNLCSCRDKRSCGHTFDGLMANTTYLMLVKDADRDRRRRQRRLGTLPDMPDLAPPSGGTGQSQWRAHISVEPCEAHKASPVVKVAAVGAAIGIVAAVVGMVKGGGKGQKGYSKIPSRNSAQSRSLASSAGL